jgi:hypothetical protein
MRPFPHDDPGRLPKSNAERARLAALPLVILVTTWLQGCAVLGSAFGTSNANADTSIGSTFRIDCRIGLTGERDGNFGQSSDVYSKGDERE